MSLGTTAVTKEAWVAELMEAFVAEPDEEQEEVDSGAREAPMLEATIQTSDPVLAEVEEHIEPPLLSPESELSSNVPANSSPGVAAVPEVGGAAPMCGPPFQMPAAEDVTRAGEVASASSSDSQFSMGQRARGVGAQGQAGGRSSASRKKSTTKKPGIR